MYIPTAYLKYIEFLSTLVSLGTMWLGIKQHLASWPIGIAITLANLPIYYQGALYDKFISGFISIFFSLYGWYKWRYGGLQHTLLKKITKTSWTHLVLVATLGLIVTKILGKILVYKGSSLAYSGALCVFLTLMGLWMSANKKKEAYLVWSLLNVISIYVHYQKAYYWFTAKYCIYLFSCVYGYTVWHSLYMSQDKAQRTVKV